MSALNPGEIILLSLRANQAIGELKEELADVQRQMDVAFRAAAWTDLSEKARKVADLALRLSELSEAAAEYRRLLLTTPMD